MSIPQWLRGTLAFLSAVAYIGFIIYIGIVSVQSDNWEVVVDENNQPVLDDDGKQKTEPLDPPEFPDEVTTLLSIVGTALAVHTGAVLGLETLGTDEDNRRRREQRLLRSPIWGARARAWGEREKSGRTLPWYDRILKYFLENLPDLGAVVYVLGLLIAVGFHFFGEQFSEASAPFLRTAWTSLVGIFAGIWAVRPGQDSTIPVPNLELEGGLISLGTARKMLDDVGLELKYKPDHAADDWVVTDQDPEPHTRVVPGTEVTLTLQQPQS
jgi:hypothetical protein